jgi:hypothetical protein
MMMMAQMMTKEERATATSYLRGLGIKVRNGMGNAELVKLYEDTRLQQAVLSTWGTLTLPTKAEMITYLRAQNIMANSRMDETRLYKIYVEFMEAAAQEKKAQAEIAAAKEEQAATETKEEPVKEEEPAIMPEPEQAPKVVATKTFTKEELESLMDKIQEPLVKQILELSARLEEWQKAAIGKPAEQIEVVDPRSEFEIAYANHRASFTAYMSGLVEGSKDIAALDAAAKKDRAIVKAMERDQRFAEVIGDVVQSFSDGTREYGHRGVNVIANVLHITVDAAANMIQATGRGVSKIKLPAKKESDSSNIVPFPKK